MESYMSEANAIAAKLRPAKRAARAAPLALSPVQKQVYDHMVEFHAENDQLPPLSAISKHFGWTSANTANEHVSILAKKGYLERNAIGKWRFARAKRVAA